VKLGCEVTFVNTSYTGVKEGVIFKRVPYRRLRGTQYYPRLLDIKKFAPEHDVINAFSTRGYVFKWLKKFHVPLIQTQLVSRLKPLGISSPLEFWLRLKPYRFLGWWMEKEACKYADVVMTTSTAMKKQIIGEYKVAEEKIRIIPRGVSVELFKSFPYPKESKIILTACRLEKEKGVQYLIDGMKIINEKFKDAELWIAGAGKDEAYLRNLAKGKPNINFLGRIPHEEMNLLYAKCSVFALTSSFEPFGAVLLEAMASGRPVIAARSGGPLDIVTDDCGILVNYGDFEQLAEVIRGILSSSDKAEEMGLVGRRRVEAFYSWRREAEAYLRLYSELIL